jgi:hypothetical protein
MHHALTFGYIMEYIKTIHCPEKDPKKTLVIGHVRSRESACQNLFQEVILRSLNKKSKNLELCL